MQHWLGLLFALIGVWMFVLGYAHRAHSRRRWADAEREEAAGGRKISRERPMNYGAMLPPLVNLSLFAGGIVLLIAYQTSGLSSALSWLDLFGILFSFVGYGTLVTMKASHRPPYYVEAEASAVPKTDTYTADMRPQADEQADEQADQQGRPEASLAKTEVGNA